jgi:hypothetical protein
LYQEKTVFPLTTLIISAGTTFIIGGLLSLLLTRSLSSSEQKTRNLEARLQDAEKNLANYQQEVTQHFSETAQLVNNLTQNYKEVHDHLAGNALKLANIDISRQLASDNMNTQESEVNMKEDVFEPPKDWAPSESALSEGYRLHDDDETPNNPTIAKV